MRFKILLLLLLIPVYAFAGTPVPVSVSVLPQKYFVEKIAGNNATVCVLVEPGKNPAAYSPTPKQVEQLMASKIYFKIGVPFEKGILEKISTLSASMDIVNTGEGIKRREMESGSHHGHMHDHESTKDPHIWLDPLLVKQQAEIIYQAFIKHDPANKTHYTENFHRFLNELDELHQDILTILAGLKGASFYVFHPSFGYFADAYGLKQVAIEKSGKAPKGKELSATIKAIQKENTQVVFVQPQFDKSIAAKIAFAIHGKVVPIDPLGEQYNENMKQIARSIRDGLTGY